MSDRTFGIQITADGKVAVSEVDKVADSLDRVGEAQKRASDRSGALAAEIDRLDAKVTAFTGKAVSLEQHQLNVNYATDKAARQFLQQGDAMALASKEVQRLLDRYDPLGTKLRALQSDFALLNKAAMGGEIGSGSDAAVDKTYRALNDEIAKTKALMVAAGAATDGSASSMGKLGLNSQYARRELMMLGREALTGDFSRMPQSFGSLIAHSNILPALLNPITLAIAGIGAAAGVMAVGFASGRKEADAMNSALATTSNYAGLTRGQMLSMADSATRAGTLTVGASKDIITQIVASGRYGAENVLGLTHLIENYAAATGGAVDKVTPQLIQMFEDPAKAAEQLNQRYHVLSVAELDRIRTLQATGRQQEAVTLAIKAFDERLPQHAQNIGLLERAWVKVNKELSDFWNRVTKIGASKTLEEQIAEVESNIALLESRSGGIVGNEGVLKGEREKLALLKASKAEMQDLTGWSAVLAGLRERELAAQKLVDQSQTHQITVLREQLTLLQSAPDSADKARRVYEINQQIETLQLGLGANERALAHGRIADAAQLYEVQNKSSVEWLDAQLKLGTLTKRQHDESLLYLDLESIGRKKADAQAVLDLGGLTKLQKQSLTDQIAMYDAMAKARKDKAVNADVIERTALLNAQAEADAKAVQVTTDGQLKVLEGYDKEIEKLKEHNAEIGMTKEKVEQLKAAEIDRTIRRLEQARALDEAEAPGDAAYLARIDAQIAKLRELQSLQGQSAILEANALFKKKEAEGWERLWGTVESTGKTVFAHLLGEGERSFAAIGKAVKAATIDLMYQLTARPWIIQLGTSFAGALGIQTAANANGAVANATGVGGWLSAGQTMYNGITSGFTGLGETAARMYTNAANLATGNAYVAPSLVNTASVEGVVGGQVAAPGASALGTGASYAGAGLAGIAIGSAIAGDKQVVGLDGTTLAAIGAMIGSIWGPVGTFVGGVIGGVVDAAFGMGPKKSDAARLQGSFSGAGFSGAYGAPWHQEGGWFRSDKSGVDITALTEQQSAAFAAIMVGTEGVFSKLVASAGELPRALGDWAFAVDQEVNTAEQQKQLVIDIATSMGTALVPELAALKQEGESLADTAVRMTDEFLLTNRFANLLGKDVSTAFGSIGLASAAMRDNLVTAMGGMQNMTSVVQSYYQNFFTDAERHAIDVQALSAQFAALNLVMPENKAGLRTMIEGLGLATAAEQKTVAQLMQLAPAFAQVADATEAARKQVDDAAAALRKQVEDDLATIQRDRADAALRAMNDARGAVWDAAETAAGKLQDMAATFREVSASITVSRNALMLSTTFGLSPEARYAEATRQAQDLLRRGQLGEITAMQGFRDFASQFLDTSAAYNASGPGFQADKAWILSGFDSLEGVADRQASIAEEQLSEMRQTVENLAGIRASALSIEQAIAAFARTQGAFQGAATSAGGNLSKDAAGALYDIESKARTQRLTSLNALYQGIFGREGDVDGLSYYANQMAAGKSLSRVEAEMLDMRAHGAHAEGLDYIPFDNYRMIGHQGETVLNRRAAEQWRAEQAGAAKDPALINETRAGNRANVAGLSEMVAELRLLRRETSRMAADRRGAAVMATLRTGTRG